MSKSNLENSGSSKSTTHSPTDWYYGGGDMSKSNLEISGSLKSTTHSPADWYYGGGDMYWPDLATALSGVPEAMRVNRTIAILINSKVEEYIWLNGATSDSDIKLKFHKTDYQLWLESGNTGTLAEYKATLPTYVTTIDGKQLSTNDFTNDYKKAIDVLTKRISVTLDVATYNVDCAEASLWKITLTENTTFTDSNTPSAGDIHRKIVLIVDGDFTLSVPPHWNMSTAYDGSVSRKIITVNFYDLVNNDVVTTIE